MRGPRVVWMRVRYTPAELVKDYVLCMILHYLLLHKLISGNVYLPALGIGISEATFFLIWLVLSLVMLRWYYKKFRMFYTTEKGHPGRKIYALSVVPTFISVMLQMAFRHWYVALIGAVAAAYVALLWRANCDLLRQKQGINHRRIVYKLVCQMNRKIVWALIFTLILVSVNYFFYFKNNVYTLTAKPAESWQSGEDSIQEVLHEVDSQWAGLSLEKRLAVMQKVADYEASVLGCGETEVYSASLAMSTLGCYTQSNESNLYLDEVGLMKRDLHDNIYTLLHEIFHKYEYSCINTAQGDIQAGSLKYQKQIQSWIDNSRAYLSAREKGYDAYATQPLEADANAYATEEVKNIFQ